MEARLADDLPAPAPQMPQQVQLSDQSARGTLGRLSHRVMQAEAALGAVLVAVIFVLLLANSLSRSAGRPLVWTDELAVHLMVWLAFLGASLGIAARNHMAIGLLPESLPAAARRWLALATDAAVLLFLVVMAVLVWRWLDLPGLIRAGWSGKALAEQSFNFVYTDPTLTLGLRKIWFWLILPVTCVTGLLHALAALAADLRAVRGQA